jgi:hypothetical protein
MNNLALVIALLVTIFAAVKGAPAQTQSPELKGEVKDQRDAVIVGAKVSLMRQGAATRATISDDQGRFRFSGLSSGSCALRIMAEGFATYEETHVLLDNSTPARFTITLYPAEIVETVSVGKDDGSNLDAQRAAGTQILTARELEALPDDPTQLNDHLQLLATSSGSAPGEAIVTVDGFRSGRLPPKSAIRQVRINPNLYSAEYDTPPFQGGRIEITTKPGAGSLTGSAFFNYNGTALNSRDPFAAKRAETQTTRYGFQLGAPIVKNRAGFFLDFEKRDIDEAAIVNAIVLDNNFQPTGFIFNSPNPKRLITGSARADWQVNPNNTLVFRYDFNQNKLVGQGIGGTNLPERGSDNRQTENSFRLTETAIINPRTVNELRIGFTLQRIEQKAVSDQPSITVAGSFSSGGANLQKLKRNESRLEIADYLTSDIGKHSLKLGIQILNKRIGELRAENTNGSFFFGGAGSGATQISSLEQYRRALIGLSGATPTRFSITLGSPQVSVSQWLLAGFVQDEWKTRSKILLSLGLRYEAQTTPNDTVSLAPRLGVAYTPDKKQNWAFRARAGIYYERFEDALTLETERLDGLRQQQLIVDSPSFPNPFIIGTIANAVPTIRILDSNLRPPTSLQMRLEIERQLPQGWKISASRSWTFNWSRLRSRNINAPFVSALNPDPRTAPRPLGVAQNVLLFESSGRAEGHVLYIGINQNANKYFTVNAGYINFDFRTDADNAFALPQSSYDLRSEWARPIWQIRHRVFLITTANLSSTMRLSASLNVSSGVPFNITTGRDNNGDGNFNDRPGESDSMNLQTVETGFGPLNPNVVNGNLRRNAGMNPTIATLDVNLSRVFVIGKTNSKGESRYKLTANIRASNALNRSNLFGTIGVLSSPFFGRPTTANQARRIEFGLRFNF